MNKKTILVGCVLPVVLVGGGIYYGVRTLLKAAPKPEQTETVQVGDVEVKVVENGTIEPLRKVEVKSKAGGRINKLWVDAGDVVKQGQILATIDPQEINSQVAALEAQLAGAEARLSSARKGTKFQQLQTRAGIAQFEQNLASAESRLHSLQAQAEAQPKLTGQAIEIAKANLEAARATLKAQQDTLNLLRESTHPQTLDTVRSTYDQAVAQARNANLNVDRQKKLLEKGFVSRQAVDTAETEAQVADARLREAKARLDRIQQTQALEVANALSQVANAQSQARQMEAALLQAQTSVLPETTRRDLESARAAYQQAKAQLDAARSNTTQDLMRGDDVVAAQAAVRQLKNQLDELLIRKNDTTLVASMPGTVTKRYVEAGELITSAIGSFSSGTPLFQIADLAILLVKINVNEVDIAKVKIGLPTEITIDASRDVLFTGRVRKVAPAALSDTPGSSGGGGGSSSGGSQTVIRFPVEIQADQADPRLRPGMSARCSIIIARRKGVLRLPLNCVEGTGKKGTVKIVTETLKDGKKVETATPREVEVGLRGDDFVEIVSGVKQGEKVRPGKYTGPPRKKINPFGDENEERQERRRD